MILRLACGIFIAEFDKPAPILVYVLKLTSALGCGAEKRNSEIQRLVQ
jgi:hypothetical protein